MCALREFHEEKGQEKLEEKQVDKKEQVKKENGEKTRKSQSGGLQEEKEKRKVANYVAFCKILPLYICRHLTKCTCSETTRVANKAMLLRRKCEFYSFLKGRVQPRNELAHTTKIIISQIGAIAMII